MVKDSGSFILGQKNAFNNNSDTTFTGNGDKTNNLSELRLT
jgi:hypothetical protein